MFLVLVNFCISPVLGTDKDTLDYRLQFELEVSERLMGFQVVFWNYFLPFKLDLVVYTILQDSSLHNVFP